MVATDTGDIYSHQIISITDGPGGNDNGYRFSEDYSYIENYGIKIYPPTGHWTNTKALGASCGRPGAATCGEPIDISTGNEFERIEDYATSGQNPLAFTRYYNSMAMPDTAAVTLGPNWRSVYDRYLKILSTTVVLAERADGQIVTFTKSGSVWTTDTDIDLKLVQSGSNWTLTDKDDSKETYTGATGTLPVKTIARRNGYTQTLTYTSGKLTNVSDSYSRALGLSYSSVGMLASVTTPDSLTLSYGYQFFSSANRLTTLSYNTTPVTRQTYHYENTGFPFALTGITDENNVRYVTIGYDDTGRATSSTFAGGAGAITVAYDDTANTRTVTNASGQPEVYQFAYLQGVAKLTGIARTATSTVPAGSQSFAYDSNGYLKSVTDWNGNNTSYVNNALGLPTQITYASASTVAHTTTIAYDTTWTHLPKTVTTPGVTTVNTYDATKGNLLTRTLTDTTTQTIPYSTNGQTRTWTYTWTATGQLLTAQLPRTDVVAKTTYGYGTSPNAGTLTSLTDALSRVTTVNTYKPGGLPLTVTDPNGVLTTLGYNTRLWLTSSALTTGAGVQTTSITYDSAGNLTRTTLPDTSYLAYTYDPAHRLTVTANGLNETKTLTLDGLGNTTQDLWKNGSAVLKYQRTATFDSLGRMKTNVAGASQTTTYTYDGNGNTLTVKDPLNHVTTNTYDALDRLKTTKDASLALMQFTYDAHDRPLTVKDAKNNTTTYIYDGFGDLIQQSSPDTGATVWTYDKDGNVAGQTDAASAVTNFTYDALDRMTARAYPADSTLNVAMTYDQTGHGKGVGRLTTVTDQSGTLSRSYDERGNITADARTIGATTYTTSYGYNPAGRILTTTYPGAGWAIGYNLDGAGQVTTVKATQPGHAAVNLATSVKHMPYGPVLSFTYGNGVTDVRTFDKAYRLLTLVDTGTAAVQNLTYTYDADDNVKTVADAVTPANNQTLNYDAIDRLLSATGPYTATGTITYDSNSNRLAYAGTAYTYPSASNRLATVAGGAVTHTATGNITAIPAAAAITYNKANQAATATAASVTSTYAYDAFGQRLKSTVGSNPLSVEQYDQSANMIFETINNVETDYAFLDNIPLTAIQPAAATISYLHTNQIAAPQKATDAAKAVVQTIAYDPNGTATVTGSITQNLRLPGQHADPTGANYNMARYYSPALGRYLQSDPIGLAGGWNTYVYGRNNALRFIDPLGLDCPAGAPDCINPVYPLETAIGAYFGGSAARSLYSVYSGAAALNEASTQQALKSKPLASTTAPPQQGAQCRIQDTTAPRARMRNIETDQTQSQIEDVLIENGYQKSYSPNGAIKYVKDGKTYTFYPSSTSTGGPALQLRSGGQNIIKIRLLP